MTRNLNYSRDILAMGDKELEVFVHLWVARQTKTYVDHEEFGNANDLGRDIVGFVTNSRHEGPWDNYQCKMLGRTLDDAAMHQELAKILYFASEGHFTPPRKYIFVAPKGFSRKAENLLNNPESFRQEMLDEWDKRCARKIKDKQIITLTPNLKDIIENFEFKNVSGLDVTKILTLDGIKFVLADTFGDDPGEAPAGVVPSMVGTEEIEYIRQLVGVYSDYEGCIFNGADDVMKHPQYGVSLNLQRRRYFDAAAFQRHFRDNIAPSHVNAFNDEVFAGVYETHCSTVGMDRLNKVMTLAASLPVSGIFGRHNRASIQVKQGTCHHFANERVLSWRK
ncbi:hypothetical protein SAE02_11650 [Skermanella aerolata]|uniref:ABC-three component systems C-terminal domain-containing protein n=1 Tax=Skermanella aerolata TaxID=393310 RepID=A0A512DKL7_9PROT|nr:ABC-three component system protein [Skermanella aerolata]GEO37017.1 hypothetical protein SAE02_11650 [Skermanella aerolata]